MDMRGFFVVLGATALVMALAGAFAFGVIAIIGESPELEILRQQNELLERVVTLLENTRP